MKAPREVLAPALVMFITACATAGTGGVSTASATRYAPTAEALASIRAELTATLNHGARAWNAGALDDFMSDYWSDTSTTYVTRNGVLHGVEAIKGVYAARFAPGAQRDSLHFEGLEFDVLAPDLVNAIAYYVLMRGDSVATRGPTSLVMRRINGRWRIIHDHSS